MNIAIIGGGAAGLMAAATIIENFPSPSDDEGGTIGRGVGGEGAHHSILLFDKNSSLGAKVIISGGGRCNVTTSITNIKQLKSKYIRGAEFLDDAMRSFTPRMIYKWFETHGVPLKTEKDGRVFPTSDNGKDIVKIFETMFQEHSIDLHMREGVVELAKANATFIITTNKAEYSADIVIITTGGNAYAHTGSTGDGYAFARQCGHSITPLGPSLNSFLTLETWPHDLSGTVFEHSKLLTKISRQSDVPHPLLGGEELRGGKGIKDVSGPVLCTHFGISGPTTFALSAHISYETVSKEQPYLIHLIPDTTKNYEQRNELLLWKEKGKGPLLVNKLASVFTRKTADCLVSLANISVETALHELKVEDRKKLCHLLTEGFPLHLIQRRSGDEFVTAGGVNTDEVDPKTMESKICHGLYFAGEVLDIDGLTGGFNLTSSRATGRCAGLAICKQLTNFGLAN